MHNVVTIFTTDKYSGELDLENDESLALKFFCINNLPLEINPPDVEILERYIKKELKGE